MRVLSKNIFLTLMVFGIVGCSDELTIEDDWEYLLCKWSENKSPNAVPVKVIVNMNEIRELDATDNIKDLFTGIDNKGYRVYEDELRTGMYKYHPVYKELISSIGGSQEAVFNCEVVTK